VMQGEGRRKTHENIIRPKAGINGMWHLSDMSG
jgi:hypothetical protein